MSVYDDARAAAAAALAEFAQGSIAYITVGKSGGTYDDPGTVTEAAPVALNAVAQGAAYKYVQGGFALVSDLQVTFAARSDISPRADDFVTIDGKKCKIMGVFPKPAAGDPVAIVLIVRG